LGLSKQCFNFTEVEITITESVYPRFHDPIFNDSPGAQHAANFIWSSGEPVIYTHWNYLEPSDAAVWGGEYYTELATAPYINLLPGDWNDENNSGSGFLDYGVVEVPEPTSVALLISASVGLFVRRHRRSSPGAT
jgi:hypothetical protein